MFERIHKYLPWHKRKERKRKEKFIKKLQEPGHGQPKIRFYDATKIPAGYILMLQDYRDGSMSNAIYTGAGKWMLYGDSPVKNGISPTKMMTTIELEDLLTEKRNKATAKDKVLIYDQSQLLNINYVKSSSGIFSDMGFNKLDWHSIGNDEDDG